MATIAIESGRISRILDNRSARKDNLTRRSLMTFESAMRRIPRIGIVFELKLTRQLQDLLAKEAKGEPLSAKERRQLDDYKAQLEKEQRKKGNGTVPKQR